jgi:hypothetical protein
LEEPSSVKSLPGGNGAGGKDLDVIDVEELDGCVASERIAVNANRLHDALSG